MSSDIYIGGGGMLPQENFEILCITTCFQKHFWDNFQMSYNSYNSMQILVQTLLALNMQGNNIMVKK